MTETIVIAEIAKGTIHATTSELVTAASAMGSAPIVIVPCTDASIADAAASIQEQAESSLQNRTRSPTTTLPVGHLLSTPSRLLEQFLPLPRHNQRTSQLGSQLDETFRSCKMSLPSMETN